MTDEDRLDSRLKDLGQSAASWVDDPWDPADVRRLGARRRQRRRAVLVVLAAVVVIVGGAGVYAVGALEQREPSPVAPPTTVSSSPTPTEADPTEWVGRGRLETKSAEPRTQRPMPPNFPTYASSTQTREPTSPESPSPTPTDEESDPPTSEPSQTSEPEPEPTSEPTGGGGNGGGGNGGGGNGGGGNGEGGDQPTEQAPQPDDDVATG